MKKIQLFAAVSLAISGVISTSSVWAQSAADATSSNKVAATKFCWKDKIQSNDMSILCNWADSAEEACKGNPMTDIRRDSIAVEPVDAKRCNNGKWLVQVTTK